MTASYLRFDVTPTSPFAFDLALSYLRTSPSTILEDVDEHTYRRAVRINGKPVLMTVRRRAGGASQEGAAAAPGSDTATSPPLEVVLAGTALTADDREAVEAIVRLTFSTDADPSPLDEIARVDPVFGRLVHEYTGLRPVLIPDLFETIVWAIIGQQINVQLAAKCKRALVDRFGPRIEVDGRVYRQFPTPERLATVSESELAALQFSRQKIRYTLNVAREVAAGRLNLDELRTLPVDEARERLESLVGIGRWTAEYVLMRGIGHRDVIPAADGGLRRIIGEAYGFGRLATEAEVRALAERWTGWRSYAAFYWWFALQQQTLRARESRARPHVVQPTRGRSPRDG